MHRPKSARAAAVLAAAVLLAGAPPPRAHAQTPAGGRCAFREIDPRVWGMRPFRNPPEIRSSGGTLRTRVQVRYTDPGSVRIAGCPVTLRTYDGALVGPTLRLGPGDVLDFGLDNRLPRETPAQVDAQVQQESAAAYISMRPNSFNTTNLHTHGLHVSPRGRGDNVLLAIPPDSLFPYHIPLPPSHTRGTYWYHAHAHGSTAIQVGSGMAGALIVEDDSTRIPAALRAANAREKIFVISTILYDTLGRVDDIRAFFPDGPGSDSLCRVGSPACTWQSSKRRTTVNGQIVPVITMRPGEVQRWRLIDGAFRESIAFRVQEHDLHEIALDGIYTGRMDLWTARDSIELQPGYRSDVLIQAHRRPGSRARADTFEIRDAGTAAARSVRGVAEDTEVIALLVVTGDSLPMALPDAKDMARLDPFPNVVLADSALGVQQVDFKLGQDLRQTGRLYFQVDYAPFDDDRVRYVELGDTDVWTVTTVGDPVLFDTAVRFGPAPHVFHIHVNPFQVARRGPGGERQTVWKDTQLIPAGDTVNLYTRYSDFTGKFVMHCHILDHEDLGMMEVVEVVDRLPLPPGRDGSGHGAPGGHGAAHGSGHGHGGGEEGGGGVRASPR